MSVIFSAKRFTVPAAVLFVACQIGESLVPVVMGAAIDRALATGDWTQLILWLGVLTLVFVMIATGFRFSQQLTAVAKERVQHRLRSTLSVRVLHPDGTNDRRPADAVVSIMTNDVTRLAAVGLGVFPVGEVAAIIFIAVSLLVIYWPLGLVVLVGAPLVVWLMGAMSGQYARDSRAYQALIARTVGKASDLVAGYRVIKGVRAEAEATARYRQSSQEALSGAKRNAGRLGRYLGGSGMVSGVFVAAVAALAGWFTIDGQMSIGGLIATAGLAQALIPQMAMVTGNAVPSWAAAYASAGRVLDTLREGTTPSPHQSSAEKPAPNTDALDLSPTPSIELTLRDNWHTSHRTVQVESGELVGLHTDDLTGARIVEALLNPYAASGEVQVLLDQTPARRLEHAAYRSRVVVAPHAAAPFSGTVAENFDLVSASPQSRAAALWAAACEDFAADSLVVGEMGNRISGGQRQRLALARALATDAPVLVLHDPTTAVDSVTEAMIAERLRELRRDRSTLLIASSLTLLGVCDRVIELRPHARWAMTRPDQGQVNAS